MRKYGKVDGNQAEIVRSLRHIGAVVQSLASVGGGCPDLLVGFRGQWYLIEVKQKGEWLTDDQVEWWGEAEYRAGLKPTVAFNVGDAFKIIGAETYGIDNF